jgi:hypothetical protein
VDMASARHASEQKTSYIEQEVITYIGIQTF